MAQLKSQHSNQNSFALYYRTFQIFMGGSLISRVGDWMDLTALNWAVLQMTNSPLHLGLINACRLVPTFLFSVPAGVLADRYDRRKLLILLQCGIMLFTFCIGYLFSVGSQFWLFAIAVTLRSILTAMDPPVRNSLIANLVSEGSMKSAIAINTAVLNFSRIAGPAIAGFLIAMTKIEYLFWISACSIAAVIFSLLMIRPETSFLNGTNEKIKSDLQEAVIFVKQNQSVQSLLILAVVPMVFGFPYTSMMPVFAKDLLRVGPEGFGILLSVSSIGAIAGSVLLSVGSEIKGAGKWLICSVLVFGLSLMLFMVVSNILLAAVVMFLVGLTSQTYRTISRITLQMKVPNRLRGRILSIALMDRGFIPLGAIMVGAIANWTSTLWAGLVMGAGCISVTLMVLVFRRQIWYL